VRSIDEPLVKIYYYMGIAQRNIVSRIVNKVLDFWCIVGRKMKSRFRDKGQLAFGGQLAFAY
jgi:hypothetical protein